MSKHSRAFSARVLMGAAALAAGAALAGSPAALAATTAGIGVDDVISPAQQQLALSYWTPARLAAAQPVDLIDASRRQLSEAETQEPATAPAGPTAAVGGSAPTGEPTPFEPLAGPRVLQLDGASSVPTNDYTRFPYSVNGRIFFSNPDGGGSCSGTSVASYHGTSLEDEVWTAGHCVGNPEGQHPGVWDTSIVFIPGYNGNAAVQDPFGEFSATNLYTTTAWLNNTDLAEDEAAFVVGDQRRGPDARSGRRLGRVRVELLRQGELHAVRLSRRQPLHRQLDDREHHQHLCRDRMGQPRSGCDRHAQPDEPGGQRRRLGHRLDHQRRRVH